MGMLSEGYGLARFATGLKGFLSQTISPDAAKSTIRERVRSRDIAFLAMLKRSVFDNKGSPYLSLFRSAGCELGDVNRLVSREGIEGALTKLLNAGVFVAFDEFKGRKAAVRGSQTFYFRDTDFDNSVVPTHFRASSSGTVGRPSQVTIALDYLADRAPIWAVWFAAHQIESSPLVFLTPYHPGMANLQLICARFGNRFIKWYATASGGSPRYRLGSALVHRLVQKAGRFPKPEFVSSDDYPRVGEFIVRLRRDGLRPIVNTSPSQAIRICMAVRERGESLRGVTFLLGYEPLTSSRRETIEASGAEVAMTYGFSEGGTVGQQCKNHRGADDVHVAADAFAVVPHARDIGEGYNIDVLALTALFPTSPKVMINAEIGDQARIETRECGCVFDELGYKQHLHTIRSFEKLTGLGVTFIGSDVFRVFEEKLPAKFGGDPTDYQLVEEQDWQGLARYRLIVDPKVGAIDEQLLIATVLRELGRMRRPYQFMSSLWSDADTIRVVRQRPIESAGGKLWPFRTLAR